MTTNPRFKSDAFEAIHSAVAGMAKAGTISKVTLREFEDMCLDQEISFAPDEIKGLRERSQLSQPVFARYLNTSESTVQKWESGAKKPSGTALKLLSVIEKHGIAVLT
jgi:putative transcriptional regulator